MATEQILDYVNKIVVVPGRHVAIQTGPGLSVKDVILPGEFIQVEIKAKSILLGFQKHIQHWLKDIAPVSYHVKSSNDSSTIVIFEDKKLANDSYKKLPALFHAHGKTIDYDKFANTFAPPDLDQVGTSSDSPSSKACANIPAKPELLMSSIFVDEPALPPIVPNDYSIKTCSICYTDFHAHEFITLECGHSFCPMCIYNAILKGLELGKCSSKCLAAPECSLNLNWGHVDAVLSRLFFKLSPEERWKFLSLLVTTKLKDFLQYNQHYKLCNGKDCTAVFMVDPTNEDHYRIRHCDTCDLDRCAACGFDPHPGEDCDTHRDKLINELNKGNIDRQMSQCLCANKQCRAPIEKQAGCNHVSCTQCGWHFCFHCLNFSARTSREVYDHLRLVHGGIGNELIPIPAPDLDPVQQQLRHDIKAAEKSLRRVLHRVRIPDSVDDDFNVKYENNKTYKVYRRYDQSTLTDKNDLIRMNYIENVSRLLENTRSEPQHRVRHVPYRIHKVTDNTDREFWKNFDMDEYLAAEKDRKANLTCELPAQTNEDGDEEPPFQRDVYLERFIGP